MKEHIQYEQKAYKGIETTFPEYPTLAPFLPKPELIQKDIPYSPDEGIIILCDGEVSLHTYRPDEAVMIATAVTSTQGMVFGTEWLLENYEDDRYRILRPLIPSTIHKLTIEKAQELTETNPDFTRMMLHSIEDRRRSTNLIIEATADLQIEPRVIQLLQERAQNLIVEGLSMREIANMLGVYRETASVVIKKLKDEGLLVGGRHYKKIQLLEELLNVVPSERNKSRTE